MAEMDAAAQEMRAAALEIEAATAKFDAEMPPALEAVEDASRRAASVMRCVCGCSDRYAFSGRPARHGVQPRVKRGKGRPA